MTGDSAGPHIGAGGLAELVFHYAHALAVAPSAAVYGELLSARSFAGTLLGRSAARQRPDLTVTAGWLAGWLAGLLAISAADLGEHAAAIIWCTDTERHGRDAAYPELLGWAILTRSLIAWYQGDPLASAAAARRGRGGGDDPADRRHGLPPAGAGTVGPADQLRPHAADPGALDEHQPAAAGGDLGCGGIQLAKAAFKGVAEAGKARSGQLGRHPVIELIQLAIA
jgi:hypothetical protein